MPLNITWDEPRPAHTHITFPPSPSITQSTPHKLKKKVSFAHSVKSTTSATTDISTHTDVTDEPAHSPESGGSGSGKKKWGWGKKDKAAGEGSPDHTPTSPTSPTAKSGWLSRFDSKGKKSRPLPTPPSHTHSESTTLLIAQPSPTDPSPTWHHHDRYFPAFSDADILAISPPDPTPTPALYTFVSPFENALTPMELQAKEHSTLTGRDVVIHYPDLPAFKDYLQGKTPEALGWQASKWGTDGWTGYGWGGEVLPDKEGKTFGAGMPEGVLPPQPGGGKKKKGKGGGEGGEGEGEDGEEDGEEVKEGEAAKGDAAPAAAPAKAAGQPGVPSAPGQGKKNKGKNKG